MAPDSTVAARNLTRLQGVHPPTRQPRFLWSSSHGLQDSERLTSWACLHLSGKELTLFHVVLGVGSQIKKRETYPHSGEYRKGEYDIRRTQDWAGMQSHRT